MTLLDCFGLYVGWDDVSTPLSFYAVRGDVQLSAGRLVVGCNWFHRPGGSDVSSTFAPKADRPSDVSTDEGRTAIPTSR